MEAEVEIKIEPEELLDLPKPEIVRESHEEIKIKTENIDKIEIDTDTHLPLSLEPLKIEESEPSPLKSEPVESTVDDESQNVPPPPSTPPDLGQGQGSPVQSVEGSSTTNTLGVENLVTKKKVKPLIGRIETVRKTYRKFFCKLCMAQVPSLEKLVIHLDREHKIRVKGPARVVVGEDRDDKKDLKVTSDLLKSIDNMPRTTEPLSESESSDEESDTDSEFDPAEEEEGLTSDSDDDEETSYLKLRTRTQKWTFHQQRVWSARIKSQLDDPNFSQCHFCFVELSKRPRFRFVKSFHLRQHSDGEYKVCPHCSMPFLYEHQLDKHLEELAVPVVPPGLSLAEGEDLLYTSHPCQCGIADSGSVGCGSTFTNRKCLLFHMTQAHDHYHRCPTCEKPFVLYSELRKHIQRSHNWEGRMMNCPVPDCNKLFNTKKGISSHFIHIHSKEEKDQYYPNNQFNDINEQTSIVRHTPPQTFWRMITAHWDKTRAHKIKAERAKRTSIWEKPSKFTPPSSASAQLIPQSPTTPKSSTEINQIPKSLFKKRPSTTSTSSPKGPGHLRWGSLIGVNSLPCAGYTGGQLIKKTRHKLFSFLCGLCGRTFRTVRARSRHVIDTHKIDLSLERPYKCPAEDCDYDRTEFKSLLKHMRKFHPVSVEEALVRRSLEEDKATAPEGEEDFIQSVMGGKTEVGEEVDNKTTSHSHSSKEVKIEPSSLTGVHSIPYIGYTGGQLVKKARHRQFSHFCGFCGRSFRTVTAKHRHIISTHNIDLSLERPYKCPVDGCNCDRADFYTLLIHMRKFHPLAAEEELVRRSLEEDKAMAPEGEEDFIQSLLRVKTEVDEDVDNPVIKVSSQRVKTEPSSPSAINPETSAAPLNRRRSAPFSQTKTKALIRGRKHQNQSVRLGQKVREVLQKFTLGSGYYCPECPITERKSMTVAWSVYRHLVTFHPHSKILKNPSTVKVEVLKSGKVEHEKDLENANQEKIDSSENMEVEPEGVEIEQDKDQDNEQSEDKDDSDFITNSSDPSILAAFRRLLLQYRLFPNITQNYSSTCPICKEDGLPSTISSTLNLQLHILRYHPGCDLLRKSNLGDFMAPKTKGVGRPIGQKSGFRRADRITKMKTNKRGKLPSPLTTLLMKHKTNCGTKYYCPDCASLNTKKVFNFVWNVVRHMRVHHPDSELFKISQQKILPSPTQNSASEESKYQAHPGLDNVNNESDSEVEVAPEIEENCDDERIGNGDQKTFAIEGKMKLSGSRGADRITNWKPNSINFPRRQNGFAGRKKGKLPSLLTMLLSKYKTKCGKQFYCPDCSSLNKERVFSVVGNVRRHIRTHHPDSELFKISQRKRFRRSKKTSESEESEDQAHSGLDNSDNGSDSEVEVAPETEENFEDEVLEQVEDVGQKKLAAKEKIKLSGFRGAGRITKLKANAIRASRRPNGFVRCKVGSLPSPLSARLRKHKTKCGTGFYCPECDSLGTKQVYSAVFCVVRHLETIHPQSELLKLSRQRQKPMSDSGESEAIQIDVGLDNDSNSEIEVAPETEDNYEDGNGLEGVGQKKLDTKGKMKLEDSDFVTLASDRQTLRAFFQFLHKYRLSPQIPKNFSVGCPLCDKVYLSKYVSSIQNLQGHILKEHPRSEILRKSNLHEFMESQAEPGQNQFSRRKTFPSSLYSQLKKFKTKCGKKFYCPDCPSNNRRIFAVLSSVIRHMKIRHKDSEMLKVSRWHTSQKQKIRESGESEDQADSEVEVAPDTENSEDDAGLDCEKGIERKKLIGKRKLKLSGLRGAGRVTKMKAQAKKFSRRRAGSFKRQVSFPSALSTELTNYKTKCGTKFYCPDCPSNQRLFKIVHSLIRHMRLCHPNSELFKFSSTINYSHKQTLKSEKCEANPGLDKMDIGSDSDVEVAPDNYEDDDYENEESEGAPVQKSAIVHDKENPSSASTSCRINLGPGVEAEMKEIKIKLEQIACPPKKVNTEQKLEDSPSDGRWYCNLCPSNFSLARNLASHEARKHKNSKDLKSSHSSHRKEIGNRVSSSKSVFSSSESNQLLLLGSDSDSNPGSFINSISLPLSAFDSKSAAEAQEKIWAEITKICSKTNPNKIQCPLCPDSEVIRNSRGTMIKKPVFPSYHYLYRHFERGCSSWKALHPESCAVYLLQRRWTCAWCTTSAFCSRQYLISHIQKKHHEVTREEYVAHAERIRIAISTCELCQEYCYNQSGHRAHRCNGLSKNESIHNGPVTPKKLNKVKTDVVLSKSPPRRKSIARPKRDSAQFSRPNYKDGSSSDEDFSKSRFELKIDRLPTIIKTPVPRPDPDGIPLSDALEMKCTTCFKKFPSRLSLRAHQVWHKRRGDIIDDGGQVKRAKLSDNEEEGGQDDDDLEEEVPPDFGEDEGLGNQLNPSSPDDEFTNDELELLQAMDDTHGSVVDVKCSFCSEWFSSPQEKEDHVIRDHSEATINHVGVNIEIL